MVLQAALLGIAELLFKFFSSYLLFSRQLWVSLSSCSSSLILIYCSLGSSGYCRAPGRSHECGGNSAHWCCQQDLASRLKGSRCKGLTISLYRINIIKFILSQYIMFYFVITVIYEAIKRLHTTLLVCLSLCVFMCVYVHVCLFVCACVCVCMRACVIFI